MREELEAGRGILERERREDWTGRSVTQRKRGGGGGVIREDDEQREERRNGKGTERRGRRARDVKMNTQRGVDW